MVDGHELVTDRARQIIADYLTNAPEQGDWEWGDHCDGLAGGIGNALNEAGWRIVQATEIDRLRGTLQEVLDLATAAMPPASYGIGLRGPVQEAARRALGSDQG